MDKKRLTELRIKYAITNQVVDWIQEQITQHVHEAGTCFDWKALNCILTNARIFPFPEVYNNVDAIALGIEEPAILVVNPNDQETLNSISKQMQEQLAAMTKEEQDDYFAGMFDAIYQKEPTQ